MSELASLSDVRVSFVPVSWFLSALGSGFLVRLDRPGLWFWCRAFPRVQFLVSPVGSGRPRVVRLVPFAVPE